MSTAHHRAADLTCEKTPHGRYWMLHPEDDDGPFVDNGVSYCGRCHHWIDENDMCSPKTEDARG